MARTLLIGTHQTSWREWLKRESNGRDLIVLDPSDPNSGSLARVSLVRDDRIIEYRFVGSLDALRNPVDVLQGLRELLDVASESVIVQCFDFRPQPLCRQVAVSISQIICPDEILVPTDSSLPQNIWPIGPTPVELESNFPLMVQSAQRRARWLEMLEQSAVHEVPIATTAFAGTRFGCGQRVAHSELERLGLPKVQWIERFGPTLLVVANMAWDDRQVAAALDACHANNAVFVDPIRFSGRVCSFARQSGQDFAMGMIEEVDFANGVIRVLAVAVPPAPVKILKIGTLTIDSTGREIGDEKSWSL